MRTGRTRLTRTGVTDFVAQTFIGRNPGAICTGLRCPVIALLCVIHTHTAGRSFAVARYIVITRSQIAPLIIHTCLCFAGGSIVCTTRHAVAGAIAICGNTASTIACIVGFTLKTTGAIDAGRIRIFWLIGAGITVRTAVVYTIGFTGILIYMLIISTTSTCT